MNNNKLYALLKKIIEYLGENGEIKMDSDLYQGIIFDMALIFFIGITQFTKYLFKQRIPRTIP